MSITSAAKRQLHRDICADPVLHGLVLNLYLNGEQYPHRVTDYFPLAAAEDPVLAARMRKHMCEEDKHVALYRKAITRIGQPVLELPLEDVFNHVIRAHTPGSVSPDADTGTDARRDGLGNFLAHLHFLETRIARSLEFHLDACAHAGNDYPQKAVAVILDDEREHAHYTREAVMELFPRATALKVLAVHRDAEARANLDFSAAQLRRLVRDNGERFPARRRWLYRACARVLHGVVNHA